MIGSFRVYIKPFNTDGTYASAWTEVTKYVAQIGQMVVDSDSQDYQLGVFRTSNVQIIFNNRDGKFTDVDNYESMFRYKRLNSQIKVTFMSAETLPLAGWAMSDDFLAQEIIVFDGLIDDSALVEDAATEQVPLMALGFESLFQQVNYIDGAVSVGDSIKNALFALLNQPSITALLTLDLANINPNQDQAIDTVDFLVGTSGSVIIISDAIDSFLKSSNSILYIKNRTIYVTSKVVSVDIKYTFYGQASILGEENLASVKNIKSGIAKVFNYFTWSVGSADPSAIQQDITSIKLNGVIQSNIAFDAFTDVVKQETLLFALLEEYKDKKKELEIVAPINDVLVQLNLLDKIVIDYPTVFQAESGQELPICGVAICGAAVLPKGLWSLTLSTDTQFKILTKTIDPSKQEITLKLRAV